MILIFKTILENNPYLGLSFFISLYIVGYYCLCSYVICVAIQKKRGENTMVSHWFDFCQFLIQWVGLIIVRDIINSSIYIEILVGLLVNFAMIIVIGVVAFFSYTKEERDFLLLR